jgi:hypothetical protein
MANTGLISLTFHAARNLISCDSNGRSFHSFDIQLHLTCRYERSPSRSFRTWIEKEMEICGQIQILKSSLGRNLPSVCLVLCELFFDIERSIELPATFEFSIRDVDTFNNPFKADFMGKGSITISEKDKEVSVTPFWLKLEDKEKGGKYVQTNFHELY